uniref:MULE transposase domain-containing protein n=1 Tax=Lactuca sativa TaxID=4236 RepID=A0A9R1WR33_LACSA|nr:hypothetical protein LSAT_V11C100002350 [Lactuca sativa]
MVEDKKKICFQTTNDTNDVQLLPCFVLLFYCIFLSAQKEWIHQVLQYKMKNLIYLANSKFDSYDELLKSVRNFYYAKGYGISIRDSSKDKYVTLQSDRGGCYRDRLCIGDKWKKNTRSRLINCHFQIVGKKEYDGGWILKAKNLTHNHEPSTDISGHPSFRRLSPNDVQSVKNMTLLGIPPRKILSSLRQGNPNLPVVYQTIYNLKAKIRKENLENRSTVSDLFEEFEKEGFIYDILHNSIGHITHLFITHPLSIKLAKAFSNIFIMDYTYKTNKYNMRLLDIIVVSCFNTSFYYDFVLLEREDEDSYIWALSVFKKTFENHEPTVIMSDRELALMNAINMVFPNMTNLLCIWHIEKNVEFELFYQKKKVATEYIKKTWLPWKENFVGAWTENYLHFGNRSSSWAEGAHVKVKQYLQVSTGGFQDVIEKICLAIKHEFNEIKIVFVSYISFCIKGDTYAICKNKKGTMTPCTGHFLATMGLPCAHKIKHLEGMTLSLDLIHQHRRINTMYLNSEDDLHNDGAKEFNELLRELSSRYQMWHENPSRFELVESSQTQKDSNSTHVVQMTNEVYDNVGHVNHENNLLDLNSYPSFSNDDMPYE